MLGASNFIRIAVAILVLGNATSTDASADENQLPRSKAIEAAQLLIEAIESEYDCDVAIQSVGPIFDSDHVQSMLSVALHGSECVDALSTLNDRGRAHSISFVDLQLLTPEDQTGTGAHPYSDGNSVACSITLNGSTSPMAAFFSPIDEKTWIGWLWASDWVLDPVRLNVLKSDVDGIRFIGTRGPFDIRVFISANRHISVVRAVDDISESDYAAGKCVPLNEDEYRLGVEEKLGE